MAGGRGGEVDSRLCAVQLLPAMPGLTPPLVGIKGSVREGGGDGEAMQLGPLPSSMAESWLCITSFAVRESIVILHVLSISPLKILQYFVIPLN